MAVHYDALDINRDIRLDLPIREGIGTRTHSIARTKPLVTIVDTSGVWTILDSYLGCITLDGVADYLWAPGADTANLDFTSNEYSIAGWIYLGSGGASMSQDLLSRFVLSTNGWELYSYTNGFITMRHHHAATLDPVSGNPRTGFYSAGWAFNAWYFLLLTRSGASGQFYRGTIDGTFGAVTTISDTLIDPESCVSNLYIGCNNGATSNWHKGAFWRYRTWGDRALTLEEGGQIWEKEVEWFRS